MGNVGENLKKYRKKNNLTQDNIANELNIARSTYARYETNERFMTSDNIIKLCKFYNISSDKLLNFNNENKKNNLDIYEMIKILINLLDNNNKELNYQKIKLSKNQRKIIKKMILNFKEIVEEVIKGE